ncbi:MAG: hypothetical protein ACOYOS_04190 [Syntrophales bacterium]
MSGMGLCEILLKIVGGVVILAGKAIVGTAVLAGKAIKGTANIVTDAQRGKRLRLGQEEARSSGDGMMEVHAKQADARSSRYEDQMKTLSKDQKNMLSDFNTRFAEQQKNHDASLQSLKKAQRNYVDVRCGKIESDLKLAEEKFEDRIEKLVLTVDAQFEEERNLVDEKLTMQGDAFNRALQNQGKMLQNQIDQLQKYVDNSKEAASKWLQVLENEITFIGNEYRHDFFCPGELDYIRQRLFIAQQNAQSGVYEVSLAQEAFVQARTLHEKLEMMEHEWETIRGMAMETIDIALSVLDQYKIIKLSSVQTESSEPDAKNDHGDYDVDVDHWTEGKWTSIHSDLMQKKQKISHEKASVTLGELKKIKGDAENSLTQASILGAQAKYAVIASILRAEMQSDIRDKLDNAGYEMLGNAWLNDDDRQSNHLVLRHRTNGDEVAIAIAPQKQEGSLSNSLELNFRDDNLNEEERREKLEAIRQVLSDIYQIPKEALEYKCKPGTDWSTNAPKEVFDIEKVKAGKIGSKLP